MDEVELAEIRNRPIGFVFQQFNLLPSLTAWRNVELPLDLRRRAARRTAPPAVDALERVGLADRVDHRPGELSGGQQQRVAVARALVQRSGVDPGRRADRRRSTPTSARDVMALFDELHQAGRTLVVITHDADVAARRRAHHPDPRRLLAQPAEVGLMGWFETLRTGLDGGAAPTACARA